MVLLNRSIESASPVIVAVAWATAAGPLIELRSRAHFCGTVMALDAANWVMVSQNSITGSLAV